MNILICAWARIRLWAEWRIHRPLYSSTVVQVEYFEQLVAVLDDAQAVASLQ